MACKYKYKNKWYSESEVKSQILRDISLNDVIVELSTQMSFTVEINTAKEKVSENYDTVNAFTLNNVRYTDAGGNLYLKNDFNTGENSSIKREEYEKALKQQKEIQNNKPTQHYARLTVPGGTNYTENEIATPAITPSIKGHAQFATDNGIGWFRSDDKHPFTGFLEDLIASGTIKKVPCG